MNDGNHEGGWLWRPVPRAAAELRLLCLSYAGGRAQLFGKWPQHLPPEIEVAAVQLPGRGTRTRERPFIRARPIVDALADALEPELDVPLAVFGHSIGALLGFELARTLRERGLPEPVALMVAAAPAPQLPREQSSLADAAEEAVVSQLQPLGGDGSALTREARALLLPYLRADLEVYDTYEYEPGEPLDCPIAAFGGRTDRVVSRADLEAWEEQSTAETSVRMLPGDHFFIHRAESVLVHAVGQALGRSTQEATA
jgi:medium-chain acyl-[acyl-carrier-protein] hydrolase